MFGFPFFFWGGRGGGDDIKLQQTVSDIGRIRMFTFDLNALYACGPRSSAKNGCLFRQCM